MSKQGTLQSLIDEATSETLLRPDLQLNVSVTDRVNSRPDMPKEAIKHIKRRLLSRNAKVLMLTLELLEFMVNNSSLPFHTQVGSKDFLNTFAVMIKNKDSDPQVKEKLKNLVNAWALKFRDCQDILPGFMQLYASLKAGGVQFQNDIPEESPSVSTGPMISAPTSIKPQGQALYFQQKQPQSQPQSQPQPHSSAPSSSSSRNLPQSKVEKLKKDLEIVKENTTIVNEMIDAASPHENVAKNDTLTELVATLRAMNSKLIKLITNLEDEEMTAYCIGIKDDVDNALKRYEDLKSGKRPAPVVAKQSQDLLGEDLFQPQNEGLLGYQAMGSESLLQENSQSQLSGDLFSSPQPAMKADFFVSSQPIFPQQKADLFGEPINIPPPINQPATIPSGAFDLSNQLFFNQNPSISTPPQPATSIPPQPNAFYNVSQPSPYITSPPQPLPYVPNISQPILSAPNPMQPSASSLIDPFASLNFTPSQPSFNAPAYNTQPKPQTGMNYNAPQPTTMISSTNPSQNSQIKHNLPSAYGQTQEFNEKPKSAFDDLVDFSKL
ncbi:unnamed protein product [Blepharisma stoltei]|uniref:Uncharacterized protein n=1 Tax=Blepharisma stoltei TaxID=1481888 RepID=A0AAU9K7G9_9CILI|nr:unnamed protein product [Blepharisma stoltei]